MTEVANLEAREKPDHPDATEVELAEKLAQDVRLKIEELNALLVEADSVHLYLNISIEGSKKPRTKLHLVSAMYHKSM